MVICRWQSYHHGCLSNPHGFSHGCPGSSSSGFLLSGFLSPGKVCAIFTLARSTLPAGSLVLVGNCRDFTRLSSHSGMPSLQSSTAEPAPNATRLGYWLALDVLLSYLIYLFHGGGLEEPGWRGFALPLLQKRYSPLRSSLILAVIWAIWHWPSFLFEYQVGLLATVLYSLQTVAPLAILFTAVFNLTGGNLPIAILLHVSINITGTYLPPSTLATGLWMLLILGVAVWMWRSPQTLSFRHS
jgi:membrane protease YdiL (CAAX protease family)